MNLDTMFGSAEEPSLESIMGGDANVAATPVAEEVVEAPKAAPTQQTAPAVKPQNTSLMGVGEDFEIGMPVGMEDALADMGVAVGDIGLKVSRVPIEKYRASTQKVDRISFLTKKVMAVKFHFFEGVGSIICLGSKCCEIGGVPQVRYLFPIAVYSTDNDGNIAGKKVELRILSAGEDLYKTIMTINKGTDRSGGIDHVDMLVTCTDDQYQKLTLTPVGEAVWRKYPQIAEYLAGRWQKDGANAYMAIARKVDEESFMKLMGLDAAGGAAAGGYDASANQDLSKFFDD